MPSDTKTGGRPATKGVIPGKWALSVGRPPTDPPRGFEWKGLSDLARLESGHTPSRSNPDYWDGEIPWIGIRDATENHGRIISHTQQYVTDLGIQNSSARVLPAQTVCLSRTASVGYVVMMDRPMSTSQDFVNWVCGYELIPRYLFYILIAEQDSVRRFAHGTTHQTLYYPEAKALHILVPSLAEQSAIVDVLGTLDDKIEANHVLIKTCTDLMQALWREAAGSTDETRSVGELADLERGLSYTGAGLGSGAPLINLSNFGRDGVFLTNELKLYSGESKDRHWVKRGDLVLANTDLTQRREILGQPGLVQIPTERALFSHHVYAVRVRHDDGVHLWLYGCFRDSAFRDRATTFATGTTVAALPKDAVLTYEVPWPNASVRTRWLEQGRELVARVEGADNENRRLAAVRDALLPKLLSGEVRVWDADSLGGEAG